MGRGKIFARMPAAALALLLIPAAAGNEIVVKNDSLEDGDTGAIQAGFDPGESAAAWLTAPCSGNIVAVQVLWMSLLGGEPQSLEDSITIFAGGAFPYPGATLEVLEGPVMTDGYLNEFRYLDEEQQVPLSIPIQEGETFIVSFKFANDPDPYNGPSVVTDIDGCQNGLNGLYANFAGWTNSCDWGVSGDWVIRAVIDCESFEVGACCVDTYCFDELTEEDCLEFGGVWQGADTTCDEVDCDPQGACCIPATEGCLDLTEGDCATVNGLWQGPDTDCETFVCFPTGACCMPDATCEDDMSPEDCEAASGLFMGHETTCDTVECPEPEGACCLENGGCLVLSEADCSIAAGDWAGPGTDCTDADENGTADACENECPEDFNGDGSVDTVDLLFLLGAWGTPDGDLDGDGITNTPDLLQLLGAWGECP
ncbi:MAG: hypothetical protein SYC29_09430 [Planctomycetota bacterium]|nr:hypothetical protein [Planctomycetota bacterium]